jgi:hypothetical protein
LSVLRASIQENQWVESLNKKQEYVTIYSGQFPVRCAAFYISRPCISKHSSLFNKCETFLYSEKIFFYIFVVQIMELEVTLCIIIVENFYKSTFLLQLLINRWEFHNEVKHCLATFQKMFWYQKFFSVKSTMLRMDTEYDIFFYSRVHSWDIIHHSTFTWIVV